VTSVGKGSAGFGRRTLTIRFTDGTRIKIASPEMNVLR
jgi:hypothetical protein